VAIGGTLGAGARRYRAVLGLPGARAPVVASALGSLPIGMFVLAVLLFARDATGSFAEAGRIAGAFGLGNAFGSVAQGRLMDRIGQGPVLRGAAAGHALTLVALVLAADGGAPGWVLGACAVGGGLTLPQLPAAMRALWTVLVDDPERRETAYALVSVMFEIAVVTAPVIVAGIVAVASPSVAVLAAAAIGCGSALAFAATGASRAWRGAAHSTGWLGPLAEPGMRTLFLAIAAMGAAVGVVQVMVPAYADARGSEALAGPLLAALSAGSLLGGLAYGARAWPGTPAARLPVMLLALGAGLALLAPFEAPAALAALLLLSGLLLAPAMVSVSTLLDTVAPGHVTEAFSVTVMAVVSGTAVGNALGGAIVESGSHVTAALTAGALAALGAAVAVARRRTLVLA
jgi:predicted MFS family arabinose efflux permease